MGLIIASLTITSEQENVICLDSFQTKGPIVLKEQTTRNLLLCFLWVLKNVEKSVLKQWWTELPHNR